jgi:hypothetical protein
MGKLPNTGKFLFEGLFLRDMHACKLHENVINQTTNMMEWKQKLFKKYHLKNYSQNKKSQFPYYRPPGFLI